jgi:cyclophilin family peptidyl-prolyl cis-trans isomerase
VRTSNLVSLFLCVLLGATTAACGDDDDDDDEPVVHPDAGPFYVPEGYTQTPFLSETAQHEFDAPGQATVQGKDYKAVLETSEGVIVLDLLEAETPVTVNSFVWLAQHHFYDGIAFHRVIQDFMAQTGDPNTLGSNRADWGTGGPGYAFGLEIVEGLSYDGAGVVGMARTNDPNSNGSQFFITFSAQPALNGQYTIFAKVDEGLDKLPLLFRGEPPATPSRLLRVYTVEKAK